MRTDPSQNVIPFPERRYGIRVGDLRVWHHVQITCHFCGHTGQVHAQSFWRQCSMKDSVVHAMKHMRCKDCGGSSINWDISQVDRNA